MTILAYIIVIFVSQFMLTAGVILSSVLSFLLIWLPDRVRTTLVGFIGGMTGSVLAVLMARIVFFWIAGSDSFAWLPFLAATIPLSIPIMNDFKKYKELRKIQSDSPDIVAKFTQPTTSGMGAMPVGALAGVILSAVLFL